MQQTRLTDRCEIYLTSYARMLGLMRYSSDTLRFSRLCWCCTGRIQKPSDSNEIGEKDYDMTGTRRGTRHSAEGVQIAIPISSLYKRDEQSRIMT